MLKFILWMMLIGGILGFIFSGFGEGGSGFIEGMKSGGGCAIKIILGIIILGALAFLLAL